ncbi:MAG: S26 family signal peptidase, partial [Bacteroidales bacterium]|nr:S26 family signal peptidase [Bacteroidales bacterium]
MKKIIDFLSNKWFIFGISAICWILFVIWLGNFWWLLGLGVIFDLCITKKVPWAFWKIYKPKTAFGKWLMGWVDAIIFAVIAASFIRIFFFEAYTIPTSSMEGTMLVGDYLFVSKCNYGPRKPMTPLSFPFVHHSMPFSNGMKKSYSEAWKRPYERMGGFDDLKNDDIVVFNFPEGDTVILTRQSQSYYQIKRDFLEDTTLFPISQRDYMRLRSICMRNNNLEDCFFEYFKDSIVVRPLDKRENYIKRCIAVAGDTLQIVGGKAIINGKPQKEIPTIQFRYDVETSAPLKPAIFEKLGIREYGYKRNGYIMLLNEKQVQELQSYSSVKKITKGEFPNGFR